ncbi:MAG: amidohydrolase family protein [candidate division Zixibacteria bacterium]|nr:amidohydrolase family protein [candidate division Zixibacteria bacterium]
MSTLHFAPRVPVIDANVCVGDAHTGPSPCRNRQQLFDEMDFHGIERAVVYHIQTEEISPVDGNHQLEDWLDDDRLIPQWSVLPTDDSIEQIQRLYREKRVSSLRLHHTRPAGLPFCTWGYDVLLDWLSDTGIPLWIPLTENDPTELVTTLREFPGVRVVFVGAHYTHALLVRPLLKTLPDAFLELSRYEPIGEIEALAARFGAHRLIYGSWYPRYAMGPMLFYLHHTRLTDEELADVCAGNVRKLLGIG